MKRFFLLIPTLFLLISSFSSFHMQQRQPMNIAVTSNIATDKNSLPLAIIYFVAIHGAWPSVVWMPDRPFMPRQWLRGRITKDFFE